MLLYFPFRFPSEDPKGILNLQCPSVQSGVPDTNSKAVSERGWGEYPWITWIVEGNQGEVEKRPLGSLQRGLQDLRGSLDDLH